MRAIRRVYDRLFLWAAFTLWGRLSIAAAIAIGMLVVGARPNQLVFWFMVGGYLLFVFGLEAGLWAHYRRRGLSLQEEKARVRALMAERLAERHAKGGAAR
ncbi:MAG: hypothetical protein ABR521_05665 [Gaiellaceae bacterium]